MVMIVDDSQLYCGFNFWSLLLTIMFAFKWFMIDDDSWQNHAKRSCNFKQVWDVLRSAISVAFEIFAKKLQAEDSETH